MPESAIKQRPGMTHLKTFPADEPLVAMVQFKGTIYVASTKSVYKLIDGEFYQMEFVFLPDEVPTDIGEKCPHGLLWDDCPDCRQRRKEYDLRPRS